MDYQTFLQQQGIKEARFLPHMKNDQGEVWYFHTNDDPPRQGKIRHTFTPDNWELFWAEYHPWMPQ